MTAPAGGALTVNGGAASGAGSTSTNTTGAFAITTRTDWAETLGAASSGLASSVLVRDQAPLTGNACGTFGSPVTLTGAPAQAGLATGCWRYTLTGTDNVGNTVSVTTTVKVDTSAAAFGAPALVVGETGPFAFVSGTTAYYNGATGAGSTITVAAPTVADPDSGVAQVTLPAPTGFTGGGADIDRALRHDLHLGGRDGRRRADGHGDERRRARERRVVHARARRDRPRRRRADRERHRGERRGHLVRRSRPRRSPSGCAPTSPRR